MNNMPVGEALANQAAPVLEAQKWPIDTVVPIPLSRRRLRERGYNQVGLIAHPLAMALGLNYTPKALARWRDTHSQVGLTESSVARTCASRRRWGAIGAAGQYC
jgi:predicted amidophosphoribosyltransferase